MDNSKMNLLDILLIISKNKKYIVGFTLIMSIIAVAYTLLVAEKWSSDAVVLPIANQNIANIGGGLLDNLGLGGGGSVKSFTFKYSAILKSRDLSKRVIKEFDLINYFEIKEKDPYKAMDFALLRLHSDILRIMINDEVSFFTIRATTKDKQLSKDIATYYLNYLIEYAQRNKNNVGRQKRELLEKRINEIESQMSSISEELKNYQEKNKIIEIQQQAKASLDSYSSILTEYFTNEIELNYAQKYLPNSSKLNDLTTRKSVMQDVLKKIEKGNNEISYLLAFDNINEKLFTINEKILALEILEVVLKAIYPQYELARIEEIDNMDDIEIIDYPHIPGMRTSPKRAVICIIVFMVSLFFSSMLVVLINFIDKEQREKISEIWKNLFR